MVRRASSTENQRPPSEGAYWTAGSKMEGMVRLTSSGADAFVEPARRQNAPRSSAPFLALTRVVVAASSLFIFTFDREHAGPYRLGVLVAILFLVYAGIIFVRRGPCFGILQPNKIHWIDLLWCILLVWPSGSLNSPVYPVFFFPILSASIEVGFEEGVWVAIAAGLASTLLHVLSKRPGHLDTFLTAISHPLSLMMLGYLLAKWSSAEMAEKRRLAMIGEISRIPNPRIGPQQVMGSSLERIRDFFTGDSCLAVMEANDSGHMIFLTDETKAGQPLLGTKIETSLATPLLSLGDLGLLFHEGKAQCVPTHGDSTPHIRSPLTRCPENIKTGQLESICEVLDVRSFITVPLNNHGNKLGRLYVTRKTGRFCWEDAVFLRDLGAHIAPLIESLHVLDRIASDATVHERQKISRDLHDSTIQPYIGLKLGLEAVRRQVPDDQELAQDLDDLIRMTTEGIEELRHYVGTLRESSLPRETSLVHAIWRVSDKYRDYHGITVEINANPELHLSDRLAAEVFQLVSEGLSNIRRHTASRLATINIRRQASELVLQIINQAPDEQQETRTFRPRSITERVRHLGGRVEVTHRPDGSTVVTIEIPL